MFIGDEVVLDISFNAARAGLANLAPSGLLWAASEAGYGEGLSGLARAGLLDSAPGIFRLAGVHVRDLAHGGNFAGLALRWEASGPGGGKFPVLDADITLAPARERAVLLRLAGAYRPPLGAVGTGRDRGILYRAASATIRTFVDRVADAIAHPAGSAGTSWRAPGQAPFRLASAS